MTTRHDPAYTPRFTYAAGIACLDLDPLQDDNEWAVDSKQPLWTDYEMPHVEPVDLEDGELPF